MYYGTANPGPWNPDAAARRQQVDGGDLRARPGHGRGALGLPVHARTTCTTTTASTRTILVDLPVNGQMRKLLRPPRPQRLPLRHGPRHRRGALGRSVRARELGDGGRSQDRRAHVDPEQGHPRGQERDRTSARPRRVARTGSPRPSRREPGCFYIPHQQPVHGLRGHRGQLHRGHAVRRREREDARRAGRPPRRAHGVGPRDRQEGVGDQGELPGLERRRRHRRRRRLLRDDGRLVQGGGRAHRRGAVAVPDGLRHHRPAGHLRGPDGKQYVAVLAGSAGGRAPSCRAICPRRIRRPRWARWAR